MHMSIRQYPIAWGMVDETLRRTRAGFVPLVRGMPGFVAYQVMDPGDTTLITVSLFETADGSQECNRRATAWVDEFLGGLVTGPPRIMMGPVVMDGGAPVEPC